MRQLPVNEYCEGEICLSVFDGHGEQGSALITFRAIFASLSTDASFILKRAHTRPSRVGSFQAPNARSAGCVDVFCFEPGIGNARRLAEG